MATTRRTETTVEIHEFYIIRPASGPLPALCVECLTGDALMVAPEQAARVAHIPVQTIYHWVESRAIHYQEGANGALLVCIKSLPNAGHPVKEG